MQPKKQIAFCVSFLKFALMEFAIFIFFKYSFILFLYKCVLNECFNIVKMNYFNNFCIKYQLKFLLARWIGNEVFLKKKKNALVHFEDSSQKKICTLWIECVNLCLCALQIKKNFVHSKSGNSTKNYI